MAVRLSTLCYRSHRHRRRDVARIVHVAGTSAAVVLVRLPLSWGSWRHPREPDKGLFLVGNLVKNPAGEFPVGGGSWTSGLAYALEVQRSNREPQKGVQVVRYKANGTQVCSPQLSQKGIKGGRNDFQGGYPSKV